MKSRKIIVFVCVLALVAGGAGALTWLKKNQRLGAPGIKATPIPGSIMMSFDLPAQVLDYTSTNEAQSQTVLDTLPKDTSYAQRLYVDTNGFWVNANVILMGMDRTSIHKPDFCLPGQGWNIDKKETVSIPDSRLTSLSFAGCQVDDHEFYAEPERPEGKSERPLCFLVCRKK